MQDSNRIKKVNALLRNKDLLYLKNQTYKIIIKTSVVENMLLINSIFFLPFKSGRKQTIVMRVMTKNSKSSRLHAIA